MEVQFDPQYFKGYLSVEKESDWVAPANPAATAGAAAPVSRPVVESFRKKPRKQTMRSPQEQEAFLNRAYDKRQADLKKLEKEAARVAKQQAAAAAVASQNWQQIKKEAADVRHSRQKAVAQRQAARAHMAETMEATRAINKAVAARRAPVEAPVLEAEQQGPAPLSCLARVPKAAGQRGRNSGGKREKKVAIVKKPTKKVGRAQGSSSSRKRPAAANRSTSALKYCRCCLTTSAPNWRTGHVQPYTGQQLCNACRIWEGRKGSLSGSQDKVGKYKEAFLAQQAQGPMPDVPTEEQATKEQVAIEQQGSTVQRIGASDSDSAQPTHEAATAPAVAAAAPDAVLPQKCSRSRRRQPVQLADIPADDAESGTTEAGPQAKRKRSAADSSVQQAEPKRAKAGCKGRHGAKLHEASTGEQGVMPVAPVAHQQRALKVRKATARSAAAL